jgi:DNA-binding NarL/FixJ family response regulator
MEDPPEALRDIRAMGVVSGMLVPLPPLSGCPVAGLIAGSEQTFEKTSGMLERDCRRLVALTHLFHARASGELMRRRDGAAALTPRERDSLQMIARGERVASVAHQLGLAEATIELHLRNARRKLGARSLPEAVARGLLYRQIEPG